MRASRRHGQLRRQLNLGINSHIKVRGRKCLHEDDRHIDDLHEPTLVNRKATPAHHVRHLIRWEAGHRCKRYRLGYDCDDFFRCVFLVHLHSLAEDEVHEQLRKRRRWRYRYSKLCVSVAATHDILQQDQHSRSANAYVKWLNIEVHCEASLTYYLHKRNKRLSYIFFTKSHTTFQTFLGLVSLR